MEEKSKKMTPKDWMVAIDLGTRFKEKAGGSKNWDKYRGYYEGKYKKGIVPINLIWSNGKIMVPKCYFRNPRIKVIAKHPNDWHSARVVEAVDNYLIKELNMKYQLKAMIEECYITGTAFGKIGYDSLYGYFPDNEKVLEEGFAQSTIKDGKENLTEYNVNVKPGMPWFRWLPSNDVVVPWGAIKSGDPEITDLPWIAHRFVRQLQDAKDDQKYKNTKDLQGLYEPDADYKTTTDMERREEYVELWEIRNLKTKEIYVISRDHEKFIVKEDDELQTEGFPITRLVFNTHPKYFWGISDVRNLEPHQMSLNVANTIFIHHVRMALKKLAIREGGMKQSEINTLLSDDFAAAFLVNGNVNEVIKELNFNIPQDLIQAIGEIRKTMRELVGYSRNEAGEFDQSTRRTATEATLVKQGSETRSSERRDIMADVLECSVRKINQIIFSQWDKPQVANIVGEDGVQYWVEYTADDIKGEYNYSINAEEAQPIDTNKITQDALALLQQFAQDEDFDVEERKKIKRALVAQFDYLGFDLEKAFAPREGMGGSAGQPIPFKEFAGGMERGKQQQAGIKAKMGVVQK